MYKSISGRNYAITTLYPAFFSSKKLVGKRSRARSATTYNSTVSYFISFHVKSQSIIYLIFSLPHIIYFYLVHYLRRVRPFFAVKNAKGNAGRTNTRPFFAREKEKFTTRKRKKPAYRSIFRTFGKTRKNMRAPARVF